jgi:polynucleotide 5'-hydroxyl-kinase GRC3/NOL9
MAHYIGATSPRSSPSHYLAAVQATLEAYRLDVQVPSLTSTISDEDADDVEEDGRIHDFIPLVINTMGWTKGLGADLNRKIEDMAQPTDVYEIEGDNSTSSSQMWPPAPLLNTTQNPYPYPSLGRDATSHLLTAIPPSVLSANYTAADHRTLSILSYFYAVFPSPSHFMPQTQADMLLSLALSNPNLTALTWNTSLPLLTRLPYEVDSNFFRNIILSGAGSEDVVPTEVGMVLNTALVGLVACQLDFEMDASSVSMGPAGNEKIHTRIPYTQGQAPPSPEMSNCLGIALVRSTSASLSASSSAGPSPSDPQTKLQMHILTPLPAQYLMQAKIVVKGEMELPIWGWLDHRVDVANGVAGLEQGKVPYLQLGKGPEGAVGGERRRVRRNLMRRSQM